MPGGRGLAKIGRAIVVIDIDDPLADDGELLGEMEAAVVAKRDDTWGETPCAFVALKPGAAEVSAETIIAWCRDTMAHYKCPRHVVFGPLPKTSTGKIQKFVLREKAKGI